jgi:streptogramin lyase
MDFSSVHRTLFVEKAFIASMAAKLLFILFVFSSCACLFAYTFDVFTDKSMKFKLVQQNGYLWMATNGGAVRWDMAKNIATEYTTAQGLSDNYLTGAGFDSEDNVWFLSRTGFDGFDGQMWHSIGDSSSLLNVPGGSRLLLSSAQGKTLYTCRYGGGADNGCDSAVLLASATDTFSDTLPSGSYYLSAYSHVDVMGRLWVPFTLMISSSLEPIGYGMFDGFSWRHIPDTLSGLVSRVVDITRPAVPVDTGAGRFKYPFMRVDGKIDTVDCGNWAEFIGVKDSLCIPPSMTIDTAGRLWIGTESGLICCDEKGATEHDFRTGPLGMYASFLVEDTKGNMWVLGNGFTLFDGRSWIYPGKVYPGIDSFGVVKAVPSSSDSGGMWLKSGTHYDESAKIVGNGIALYNGRSWDETRFYTKSDGLASDAVLDMVVDNDNTVWCVCGGDSTHLCMFKKNIWTSVAVPDSVKGQVRQMYADQKGGIWLLANNPARFDGARWQVFSVILYEGYAGCNSMFEDSKGTMWFATYSHGLYRYDGTSWSTVIIDSTASASFVSSIGEDTTGALWVGLGCDWTGGGYTNCKGLWRQNGSGWKKFTSMDGLGFDLVTTMSCDKSGAMWFACSPGVGAGVNSVSRFDGARWETYTMKDGLSDPRVRFIYNAKNGDIWFATYNGITRLKSSELGVNFAKISKPARLDRYFISKVLVAPGYRSGKSNSAVYYDIRGRRVGLRQNMQNRSKKPVAYGIYIERTRF